MSPAEIKKAAKFVKAEGADSTHGKSIADILRNKIKEFDISHEV